MDLKETFLKARDIFVEVPEHEEKPESAPSPRQERTAEEDELNARLEAQAQSIRGLNAGRHSAPVQQPPPAAAPPASAPKPVPAPTPPSFLNEDGSLRFDAIYSRVSLPSAPFTAEQTLDMLRSLPTDLPIAVRRQTVQVMIDAMSKSIGATRDSIINDAGKKRAALIEFGKNIDQQAADFLRQSEQEIQHLTAQIEEKRNQIASTQRQAAAIQSQCQTETARLDEVLEFFQPSPSPQ